MSHIASLRFASITVCLMNIMSIPGMAIAQAGLVAQNFI